MEQNTLNHLFQSTSNMNLTEEIVFVSADNSIYHEGETKEDLNAIFQGLSAKEQIVETAPKEHEVCPLTELCTIQVLTVSIKNDMSEVNEVTIPEALASSLRFVCKVCENNFPSYSDFDEHAQIHRANTAFGKKSPGCNDEVKMVDGSGDNKRDKDDDSSEDSPGAPDIDDASSDSMDANSSQIASIAQELIGLAASAPKTPVSTKQELIGLAASAPKTPVSTKQELIGLAASPPKTPVSTKLRTIMIPAEEDVEDPFLMLRNDRFDYINVFCFQDMSCPLCDTHFTDDALWEEHVRLVHQKTAPFQCIVCGKEFIAMAALRGHVIKVHGKFSIMVCEKKWNKNKKNVAGESAVPCRICRGSGMSDREVLKDVDQIDPPPESINFQRKYVPRFDKTCPVCGKVLSSRYFTKHLKLHATDKPFECSFCGQKFFEKLALNRHVRTHTKEKPFKCVTCGSAFALQSTLTRHMVVHTGVKKHECPVCQKKFVRKSSLTKHQLIHTICKEFDCTLCDRSFTLRRYLWRHYKTVHGYSVSLK